MLWRWCWWLSLHSALGTRRPARKSPRRSMPLVMMQSHLRRHGPNGESELPRSRGRAPLCDNLPFFPLSCGRSAEVDAEADNGNSAAKAPRADGDDGSVRPESTVRPKNGLQGLGVEKKLGDAAEAKAGASAKATWRSRFRRRFRRSRFRRRFRRSRFRRRFRRSRFRRRFRHRRHRHRRHRHRRHRHRRDKLDL